MKVELRDAPFEPLVELGCYQAGQLELKGQYGATAIFIGTVRASNEQAAISRMSLEHYPGMTERYLQRIVETAAREWPCLLYTS